MRVVRLLAALCTLLIAGAAAGQEAEEDFRPARTSWGDPDFRGTWPIQNVNDVRIPLERPADMGERAWLTDEEFAERLRGAERSDAEYANELRNAGTTGLAAWLRAARTGRQSSLIVGPANGRLPPLTPQAQTLYEAGRSSWKEGQTFDWVSDLDAFDRCITRGFPAMMLPKPYNNGVRIFQSPGYVALQLEMFGTRMVPVGQGGALARARAELARRQSRALGWRHAGDRDHQYRDRRQRHAGCLASLRIPAARTHLQLAAHGSRCPHGRTAHDDRTGHDRL